MFVSQWVCASSNSDGEETATGAFCKILPDCPRFHKEMPALSYYMEGIVDEECHDSIVWRCVSETGDTTKMIFDLRIEPDSSYRKLLYLLGTNYLSNYLTYPLSERESYKAFIRKILDFECDSLDFEGGGFFFDSDEIRKNLIVYCTDKEFRRQIADVYYERQDPNVFYVAWENFDRKRCPWYESYRDSILKNDKLYDLSVLIFLSKNAKDYKEYDFLWNEYCKREKNCLHKKRLKYLLDNNETIIYEEFRAIPEIFLCSYEYGFYQLNYYKNYYGKEEDSPFCPKEPFNYDLLRRMERGYAMFVTELSCQDEITQQRVLLDLEIPMGHKFDINKCIETIERENAEDKKLKAKVLKALRKAQKN